MQFFMVCPLLVEGPRRPYFPFFVLENLSFCSSYTVPSIIQQQKHALRLTAYLPSQSYIIPLESISQTRVRRSPPSLLYYQSLQLRLVCLNPVKVFLYFGHSTAPDPYSYVAALVPYGTPGFVRSLNRWEYEW